MWITTDCEIYKEMGKTDHLTCLLRNLYAGQEVKLRTRRGTKDWFKIGNGVRQGCLLSPWLFNLYSELIMWNARLNEAQAGIRLGGEIWITSDMQMTPPLMIERKKELKSPLMKVKEESEKAGLKLNIQKMKIMASDSITARQTYGGEMATVIDYFLELQNHCRQWLQSRN